MSPDPRRWISVEREVRGEIMKTDVFIKLVGPAGSETKLTRSLDEAFDRFRSFEKRFSRFREESELSRFNRSIGGPVSDDLFALLELSLRYHRETGGIFDPSVLPILQRIGYPGEAPPEGKAIQHARFEELVLDRSSRSATKPLGLQIDLGGIGKGYIVGQVARFLRQAGYTDFVVDAGGDIYAGGANREEGYPYWAFDIEHPLEREQAVATVLLSDESVATSGRNRRTWTAEGKRKHHLIDPRVGDSATSRLLTVSVVARTAVMADIWAKTLFILGESEGMALATTHHLSAFFVAEDERTSASPAWDRKAWKPDAYQDIMESLCKNFSSGSS